jgi:hypothetical protein
MTQGVAFQCDTEFMKRNLVICWIASALCLALSGAFACRPGSARLQGQAGKLHIDDGGAGDIRTALDALHIERVRNAGHWLQLDQPEQFNQQLDRFLQVVDLTQGAGSLR